MKKNGALQEFCRVAKIPQLAEFGRLRNFKILQPVKFRILENAFPAATVHHAGHCSLSCACCFLIFFLLHFLFLPTLTLLIAFDFGFFFL